MMLKKQTVWLLTMLSLLIVLSVYYMTQPNGDQIALVDVDDKGKEEQNGEGSIETNVDEDLGDVEVDENGNLKSSTSTDELFTSLRMDLNDARSKMKEQYEDIMTNENATVDEKNEAFEAMTRLDEIAYKESLLEKVIQSENSYDDVFVRAEEDVVHVTVKANESTKTEANNIMQMVRDEFGEMEVQVKFQPVE